MTMNRRGLLLGGMAAGAGLALAGTYAARQFTKGEFPFLPASASDKRLINGIIWQVHEGMLEIHGEWELLGADTLMLQWIVAEGKAYAPGLGVPMVEDAPNWARVIKEPWAKNIILGLATGMNEPEARRNIAAMVELSARIAEKPMPFEVSAYYFPVEADPTWADVGKMGALLAAAKLPRPLWVSAYDNSNIGAEPFAEWVASWLPPDIGLMFQDGVGLHMRTPEGARHYGQVLRNKLGENRFTMIAEAFRPADDKGNLRRATLNEFGPQLLAYHGFEVIVFEGPHYLDRKLTYGLVRDFLPRVPNGA